MSDRAIHIQAEEQRTVDLHNTLNTFLQGTSSHYENTDRFFTEYGAFIAELSTVFQGLKQYAADSNASHVQAQEQARTRAAEHSKTIDEAIATLDAKRRELESCQATIRQATGNLDSKAVAKLKVKETVALQNLFTALYQAFYPEEQNAFEWAAFKKDAVEKKKLADFNNRLINADYTKIAAERIDTLDALKNDSDLAAYAALPKKAGASVVELINISGVVRSVADLQREIPELQTRIEGLRAEAQAIEKEQASENEFAKKRNEHLVALTERMTASAAPFSSIEQTTNETRQAFEDRKNNVRTLIAETETKTRQIPESVYTALNEENQGN